MLKKIFHPVLVVSLLAMGLAAAACSDSNDEGPKSVELTGGTSTEQTVYADETQKPENITFKAAAPWTATVTDTTPVQTKAETGNTEWLKLDHYSGEAGDVSLTMTLSLNLTGHDRKAEIRIVCGGTTIVITVEQKATTEKGEVPQDLKNRIDWIERKYGPYNERPYNESSRLEFSYDKLGRLIHVSETWREDSNITDIITGEFTYGDKTVVCEVIHKDSINCEEISLQSTNSAVLDENGRVVSNKITSKDEGKTEESSSHFTYDTKNGQLIKTETICKDYDGSSEKDLFEISWTNGNPTQVIWTFNNYTTIDRVTYGTIKNKTNLDLNWFIALDTEGWYFSIGENQFLAAMGYMGKRSQNMAESVKSGSVGYSPTYRYQFDDEGRINKIIGNDPIESIECTIHYAE